MIKFNDGFTVTATVEQAIVNINDDWQKVIIIKSDTELNPLFLSPTEFEYGGLRYTTAGFVKSIGGGVWVKFKSAELIVNVLAPKVNELEQENNLLKLKVDALASHNELIEGALVELMSMILE